jgi:putative membrane protein
MSSTTAASTRRSLKRPLAIAALALVPLIMVGLLAGALSAVGSENSRIPAAIVNLDEIVQQTNADGTTTPVIAGRLLVTALTAPADDSKGASDSDSSESAAGSDNAAATAFDWTITGEDEAEQALKDGSVYAVITIPKNFSKSVVSLGSDDPVQANLAIKTDDAHGYVTGPLTDALGDGLAAIFGTELSKQFIKGLVGGTGQIGSQLTQAADGASGLQSGATALADGLNQAATSSSSAATGASALADGVDQYTSGVSELSDGLSQAADSSAGLQQLPQAAGAYVNGAAQSADGLRQLVGTFDPADPRRAAIQQVIDGLDQLGAQAGPGLTAGAQGAAALQSGVQQLADGADQLSVSGPALTSGVSQIADGLGQLSSGIGQSSTGASQLADGAGQLADGLNGGAEQVPSYTDTEVDQISDVAADPVGLSTERQNEVSSIPQIVSALLVPAGLWIGALAVFLVLGPITRRVLVTAASTGRIGFRLLGRAAVLGAVQAVPLVLLLHIALGVSWASLPATLLFGILVAIAFAAIHAMLTTVFGRAGLVASLVLLALQLISTGGLYPIEIISAPFRAVSPLLPLTAAVDGLQAIITGSGSAGVVSGIASLVLWTLASGVITLIAVGRRRSARSLGLIPAAA